jgi:hypothetical protein
MSSTTTAGVADTDVANVLNDIQQVVCATAATPKQAGSGVRNDHIAGLEKAEEHSKKNMARLLASPHAQLIGGNPKIELSGEAVKALRSLMDTMPRQRWMTCELPYFVQSVIYTPHTPHYTLKWRKLRKTRQVFAFHGVLSEICLYILSGSEKTLQKSGGRAK